MVYEKKNIKNTLQTLLQGSVSNSDTLFTITTGEGAIFPTNLTPLVVEQFNSSGVCFKREIVNLTGKTGDILQFTRAYEPCVQDDTATPKTITQNALSFDLTGGVVKISQYNTAKITNDIQDELELIRSDFEDADLLKANNCTITPISADYTFTGTEINNTGFSINTTSGDITIDLDLSLFATTNGLFEFTFYKSTADSNSVIIDVGAGKTIDGTQTYELTVHNESITIEITSATFAKVVSTSNKPIIIPTPTVQNFTKELVAGEVMSALQVYRRGESSIYYEIEQLDKSLTNSIGYDITGAYEKGQAVNFTGILKDITLSIAKVGTGGNIVFNMEVFSNATFTTLIGTSNETITASTLTTSMVDTKFTFNNINCTGPIYIKANIVSGTVNTTNYAVIGLSAFNVNAYPLDAYYITQAGVVVGNTNYDWYFRLNETTEDVNKFYLAKANFIKKLKTNGIVTNSVILDANFNGAFAGIIGGFSGLLTGHNINDVVFLGNDGNIAFTPGINPISIGRIFSDTEIFLEPYNQNGYTIYNIGVFSVTTSYTTAFLATKDTRVTASGHNSRGDATNCFLQVSNDNVNWTTVWSIYNYSSSAYNSGSTSYTIQAGQYVRLGVSSTSASYYCEGTLTLEYPLN